MWTRVSEPPNGDADRTTLGCLSTPADMGLIARRLSYTYCVPLLTLLVVAGTTDFGTEFHVGNSAAHVLYTGGCPGEMSLVQVRPRAAQP